MDQTISEALTPLIRNTRCGASVWTTFPWLGNGLYVLAWVIALPLELVLNRRVGRRYAGLLPLSASYMVLALFIGLAMVLSARIDGAPQTGLGISGMVIVFGLLSLGLLHQRLGDWWRFRGSEHVYGFSCGIPIWLFLPRPISFRLGQALSFKKAAPSNNWSAASKGAKTPWAAAKLLLVPLLAHLRAHWSYLFDQWRSGVIPVGPFAWIAATIVHPILVIALGILAFQIDRGLAGYLIAAGVAIFFKARIEKANAIETVYNVFDSRIEQQFMHAITSPREMANVERQGMVAAGLASLPVDSMIEPKPPLAPELAKLVTDPDGEAPPSPQTNASPA